MANPILQYWDKDLSQITGIPNGKEILSNQRGNVIKKLIDKGLNVMIIQKQPYPQSIFIYVSDKTFTQR